LPLELASEPLDKIWSSLLLAHGIPSGSKAPEGARALFADSFGATFESAPGWLRELYLGLATDYGSLELAPALARLAEHAPAGEQVLAVNALAALTGWDERFDAAGNPREVSVVAAAYAAECARH